MAHPFSCRYLHNVWTILPSQNHSSLILDFSLAVPLSLLVAKQDIFADFHEGSIFPRMNSSVPTTITDYVWQTMYAMQATGYSCRVRGTAIPRRRKSSFPSSPRRMTTAWYVRLHDRIPGYCDLAWQLELLCLVRRLATLRTPGMTRAAGTPFAGDSSAAESFRGDGKSCPSPARRRGDK